MKDTKSQEKLLERLKNKLEKEQQEYEAAGLPEYNRLPKTRLFSSLRKQDAISRRIAAVKLAIDVLEKPFGDVDVSEAVNMAISDRNDSLKDELMYKAESIFLAERKEACRMVFEQNHIIALKQLSEYLD